MAAHRGGRDGRGPVATVEQQHPGRAAHPGKPDPEGTRGVRQPLFSISVCLERDSGLGHLLVKDQQGGLRVLPDRVPVQGRPARLGRVKNENFYVKVSGQKEE